MINKLNYAAFNQDVAQLVPSNSVAILDIGCGNGAMGQWLKRRQPCIVHGVTYSTGESKIAGQFLDKVWVANLNEFDLLSIGQQYDCIICSHVLEHLYEPWQVMQKLESVLLPGGIIIVALPNLLFWKQRWQLLRGRFRYQSTGGLLDITHYRFFDWDSTGSLYEGTSLKPVKKFATGMFPQPLIRKIFPSAAKAIDRWIVKQYPGLFGFQFLLVHSKPWV